MDTTQATHRPVPVPATVSEAVAFARLMTEALEDTRCTLTITPGRAVVTNRLAGWATNSAKAKEAKAMLVDILGTKGLRHARHGRRTVWGVYFADDLDGAACGVQWEDKAGHAAVLMGAAWRVSTRWGREGLEIIVREPNGTQRIEAA